MTANSTTHFDKKKPRTETICVGRATLLLIRLLAFFSFQATDRENLAVIADGLS
jgi:hypothetical protein